MCYLQSYFLVIVRLLVIESQDLKRGSSQLHS